MEIEMSVEIGNEVYVRNGANVFYGIITEIDQIDGQPVIDYETITGKTFWAYFDQIITCEPVKQQIAN